MKKFKFEKPFASFDMSYEYFMKPLKEKWRIALHDPAYLIIFGSMFAFLIVMFIIY